MNAIYKRVFKGRCYFIKLMGTKSEVDFREICLNLEETDVN